MKRTTRVLIFLITTSFGTHASAYSGELWLSQANQAFGTPASMLAHGFLAGIVHSWNNRREQELANFVLQRTGRSNADSKFDGSGQRLYQ